MCPFWDKPTLSFMYQNILSSDSLSFLSLLAFDAMLFQIRVLTMLLKRMEMLKLVIRKCLKPKQSKIQNNRQ